MSLFSQIVSMGKREQGEFCLSNLSEQDTCLVFPYQLSQGDSWLMCFSGYSLPSLLAALFHVVCRGLWLASSRAQLTAVPVAAPSLHLLPPPKHLSTPAGNQEGNGKTQSRDMIRNKASNKLSGMGQESRRRAVGCPNERRVILIALSQSKETNKSH